MKSVILILAAIFIVTDCSADARVLEQLLRSRAKASAKAKQHAAKKKSQKKVKKKPAVVKKVKPKVIVTQAELNIIDGLAYLPDADKPFTGKHQQFHPNGKKYIETSYKDGKKNGVLIMWDEYEHKVGEINYLDGQPLE